MKSALYGLALAALGAVGPSWAVEPAQSWRVAGKVASFAFTLNCDFRPAGTRLGGVCVDASTSDPTIKGGRAHKITRGRIDGDTVSWTYVSSFLLSKFDVTFDGTRRGQDMSGVIHVQGHDGAFTATRQ
ncbi:hypothetical protein [Phenylobacterium montanum]|uniref:Uncharacterized protein n=1 Tax=Phenylobacterium montanum TaxID=2823693 RepID=A0A975IVA0_9CAUL|nr:hypothetical protein [Caulobacter sp. S6]QUD88364.1 hypothetical protein KCG34_00260 [Caulobacter sp. S6]